MYEQDTLDLFQCNILLVSRERKNKKGREGGKGEGKGRKGVNL
jgi:hypothetical protein